MMHSTMIRDSWCNIQDTSQGGCEVERLSDVAVLKYLAETCSSRMANILTVKHYSSISIAADGSKGSMAIVHIVVIDIPTQVNV